MDINIVKEYVKTAYGHNENWCKRVDNMPNNQILAIYYSLLNRTKNSSKSKKLEENHQITLEEYREIKKEEKPKEEYHQITINEYLKHLE